MTFCIALYKIDITMHDESRQTRKQLSVTIATRFDRETAGLLREVAGEKGIGVTTLIRMWTLDRLKRFNKASKRGELIDISP